MQAHLLSSCFYSESTSRRFPARIILDAEQQVAPRLPWAGLPELLLEDRQQYSFCRYLPQNYRHREMFNALLHNI
jgi:hypothetical protein